MVRETLTRVALKLIKLYQTLISPLLGPRCRYYPSCSTYMAMSLQKHGLVKGGSLGLRRLLRCHPYAKGGIDFPPDTSPEEAK